MKKVLLFAGIISIGAILFFLPAKLSPVILSEKYIINTLPSNEYIFTQGIEMDGQHFLISSGAPSNFPHTKTVLGIMNQGKFEEKIELPKIHFFGEGLTKLNNTIYWTFWKNGKIFAFDEKFQKIDEKNIDSEGWGLTNDGAHIILSNGSNILTFFDKDLSEIKKISVTEKGIPIEKINELEYINDEIWANIWLTNDIIRIKPTTGEVIQRYNFNFLKNLELIKNPNAQEMNGIAFDKEKNHIILTGKMWKNLYVFDKGIFDE